MRKIDNQELAKALLIMNGVMRKHQITMGELVGKRRTDRVVIPRREAMRQIRKQTSLSFPQIGSLFNRDHSTVLKVCKEKDASV